MGMFDSIYAALKCPECGDEGEKELQTKDLRCYLDVYRIGDSVGTTQYRWLYCLASCRSETCQAAELARVGYRSGFGSSWDVFAEVDDAGRITGRIATEYPPAIPRTERNEAESVTHPESSDTAA